MNTGWRRNAWKSSKLVWHIAAYRKDRPVSFQCRSDGTTAERIQWEIDEGPQIIGFGNLPGYRTVRVGSCHALKFFPDQDGPRRTTTCNIQRRHSDRDRERPL